MKDEGRLRVVIESVRPQIDCGLFPIKRVQGERVPVEASVFADGHDAIAAVLRYRSEGGPWLEKPMIHRGNDLWRAAFAVEELGAYFYTVVGWVDHFLTWRNDLGKRLEAGQDLSVEFLIGGALVREAAARASGEAAARLAVFADLLESGDAKSAAAAAQGEELTGLMEAWPDRSHATTYERELRVEVDRERARFSTWYELFPRSHSAEPRRHGTFADCARLLPEIARMGFDVVYLPPIHPIGKTNRKGANNKPAAGAGEHGSPWAIGSEAGGHKAVAPELGTLDDFSGFVREAEEHGIEVALDLAYQASPDHPYVASHPEWFRWRPDGTVQYAENPPKKYQDVLPLNFETEAWRELWDELKSVVEFWIDAGVRIFRVDNPHTKPFRFWESLIAGVKREHPEVIFLSEAFTRPKVMYRLAKLGFTQSYTYFTWRNTKQEIIDYVTELVDTDVREYFRPNFWPNTPDILPELLQIGGRPAFVIRLLLAGTLSSNYGIYGPAYELLVADALPGKEEYLDSEKYEVKHWDWDQPGNLKDFIARLNRIRRENAALQETTNLRFVECDNDSIVAYMKVSEDQSNTLLICINVDTFQTQAGNVRVSLEELGISAGQPFMVQDLLSNDRYIWHGEWNYVELNPNVLPGHVFRLQHRLRREMDFDYFL